MPHGCVILADSPGALVELCGISVLERLLRTLQRCGITRATVLSSTPEPIEKHLAKPSWARSKLEITVRLRSVGLVAVEQIVDLVPEAGELLLVIRGDHVFDNRLLNLLSARRAAAVLIDSAKGDKLCGAALLSRDWLPTQSGSLDDAVSLGLRNGSVTAQDVAAHPLYDPSLRRNLAPFWFAAPEASQKGQAERILLNSVQKGSQDLPAYVHAPIERFLVSHLCKTSIKPNHITVLWAIAALATTILFATGHLLWGVALALVIGILDGLDGKQARLKVETTKRGKLDHKVDTFLEAAWPTALAYHFYASGQLPEAFIYLAILLGAEILDGIGKLGVYLPAEKSLREPGSFDRVVRLLGGRRNIYIWVLIVCMLLGTPARALIVMAWWEVATAVVDLVHAAWIRGRLRQNSSPSYTNSLL